MKIDHKSLSESSKKKLVENTVREFLMILEKNNLEINEGLVAWNMLGFTIFQDLYPNENHKQIHERMIKFSQQLFYSSQTN